MAIIDEVYEMGRDLSKNIPQTKLINKILKPNIYSCFTIVNLRNEHNWLAAVLRKKCCKFLNINLFAVLYYKYKWLTKLSNFYVCTWFFFTIPDGFFTLA